MKMKSYFFYWTILAALGLNSLHGADNKTYAQENPRSFSLSRRLKTINPNAPQQDYDELAQALLDADLSACQCVQHLIEAKQEKWLKKMVKENIISKEDYEKINYLRRTNFDYKPSLIVHLPKWEAFELEDILEKEVAPYFPQHSIALGSFNEEITDLAATKRKKTATEVKKSPQDHLYLGILFFFKLSAEAKKSILFHEKEHLMNNHFPIRKLIRQSLNKNSKSLLLSDNDSLLAYLRSQEAEADRVPAVRGSCSDAHSFIEFFEEFSKCGFMDLDKTTKSTGLYPSDFKRYAWAQRIYRLKVAEELKKEK